MKECCFDISARKRDHPSTAFQNYIHELLILVKANLTLINKNMSIVVEWNNRKNTV